MTDLADEPDRGLARGERDGLDRSLFVEAGAGSGKTTVLVSRVVALVRAGTPLRHIAAVTFTEKAAAELRDRIRVELSLLANGDDGFAAREALDELDTAAIGTLHSFANRVLGHHPVEVGLPPLLELSDEVASQIAADRRFDTTQALLLRDPEAADSIRLALAGGMTLDDLRKVARALDSDWDLVEERLARAGPVTKPTVQHATIVGRIDALLGQLPRCADGEDKLHARIEQLLGARGALLNAVDDTERLQALARVGTPGRRVGQAGNWAGIDLNLLRDELKAVCEAAQAERDRVLDLTVRDLVQRLAARCLADADQRRETGRLEFHDLLVLARRLVRSPEYGAVVRGQLQQRYRRILLDEFQDTDPIQVELAVRIAGGAAASHEHWRDVVVPSGSLFLVGDPKQSIYRFRRADITTFLRAGQSLGERLLLSTNFRSCDAVIDWVNHVFDRLIHEEIDVQPQYVPLDVAPDRAAWVAADGPAVVVLGAEGHADKLTADELRQREATDVAQLVVRALSEGWRVADRHAGWGRRALVRGDITILVPARTSISALEVALDAAGLSYRTEAASLVYSAPEVRELLLVARAVDDPTDELAVVGALRSSILGCGDDDLWRWKAASGRWNVFAAHPDVPAADPVAGGMTWLRDLAKARSSVSPSALLDRMLHERQVLEAALDSPRYRETWRRLRFVVDQARAWSEAEHGSLRDYLAWAGSQSEDTARVSEAVLPETDSDSVRITTIHAAKGLQFPFTIVTGLTSAGSHAGPAVIWSRDAGWEARMRKGLETTGYEVAATYERLMEHREDVRKLYVACTRAESHLAVSLHRVLRAGPPASELSLTLAEQLAASCEGAGAESWSAPAELLTVTPVATASPAPLSLAIWTTKREAALQNAGAREAESATDIAHGRARSALPSLVVAGLDKQPRDLELPPWAKGRYGTAIGRAVHGVLQTVNLATGEGLRALASAQVLAEGVPDELELVVALTESALRSPLIRRAAASEHWRETYVGTVVDDVLVEGYVDLLFRDDQGLVVVDFKTDAAVDDEALSAYALQLSVYARAVSDAAGEPVTGLALLFLRPDGAVERWLEITPV